MVSISQRQQRKDKKKKIGRYLYWAALIFLLVNSLFFTRYNLITYFSSRHSNRLLKEELTTLRKENAELKGHIDELRTNPEAWERVAREKYNMLKQNEKMILFSDPE